MQQRKERYGYRTESTDGRSDRRRTLSTHAKNHTKTMLRSALAPLVRTARPLASKVTSASAPRFPASSSASAFAPRFLFTARSLFAPEEVSVTFQLADGKQRTVKTKVGENLLDVVIDNEIDIDGFGACEGTLACSTCHLIFKQEDFDRLPDEATDEELDMLDLDYGLTEPSRLGCQVCMTTDLDGMEVRVPEGVNDQR